MQCNQNVLGMNNDAYFYVLSSCSVIQNVLRNELHNILVSRPLLSGWSRLLISARKSSVLQDLYYGFPHSLQTKVGALGLPFNNPGQFASNYVSFNYSVLCVTFVIRNTLSCIARNKHTGAFTQFSAISDLLKL